MRQCLSRIREERLIEHREDMPMTLLITSEISPGPKMTLSLCTSATSQSWSVCKSRQNVESRPRAFHSAKEGIYIQRRKRREEYSQSIISDAASSRVPLTKPQTLQYVKDWPTSAVCLRAKAVNGTSWSVLLPQLALPTQTSKLMGTRTVDCTHVLSWHT